MLVKGAWILVTGIKVSLRDSKPREGQRLPVQCESHLEITPVVISWRCLVNCIAGNLIWCFCRQDGSVSNQVAARCK